jgi:hypothetical protein
MDGAALLLMVAVALNMVPSSMKTIYGVARLKGKMESRWMIVSRLV